MIPVTTFAGKKVAVFGLGGSGLASAQALVAGGADVIALRRQRRKRREGGARPASPTADLRTIDWSKIAALVLAPGVPLTHPAPHWTVGAGAATPASRSSATSSCSAASGARSRRDSPFVAITGTNGKSTTTALIASSARRGRPRRRLGGNIGTAILSLEPPARAAST